MRLITKIARSGTIHDLDGNGTFYRAMVEGLLPDPSLPLDEWSEQFMVIPRSTGAAEYGKYRLDRTPHARVIMQCLSEKHQCRRVILKAASQMLKTQVALNWFCYVVHQHPANFLWLMPTGKLHKRIVQRIDRNIDAVEVVKPRVSPPGSRQATNSQDIKVFQGGTLFIATAGSAANLAEVPAKYVSYDEVDRSELSVDGEGDPIKLAEARQTTFSEKAKSYYYSSPTIEGESRIEALYNSGTQRVALAECVHCGHAQELVFENLIMGESGNAIYPCSECGGIHHDSDKRKMFANGLWSEAKTESENESFTISAMYQPYGWLSWTDLIGEYNDAKQLLDSGSDEQMIVFYNTRLARAWERTKESTNADELSARAEPYKLGFVPMNAIELTAAIDTQADRVEIKVVGWGDQMECWIVDYRVVISDPSDEATWKQAYDILTTHYEHESGAQISVKQVFVDSGGHHTQEVYNFTMRLKSKGFFPIKGDSKPSRPIIPNTPSTVDFNYKGSFVKKSVKLWKIGTDTAKDYLFARWKKTEGQGAVHFSNELPEDYYQQLVSEYRSFKYVNGNRRSIWEKKKQDRNEALDLMVYNLAAAYKLGLHRLTSAQWAKKLEKLIKSTDKVEQKQEESEEIKLVVKKRQIKLRQRGKFNVESWS